MFLFKNVYNLVSVHKNFSSRVCPLVEKFSDTDVLSKFRVIICLESKLSTLYMPEGGNKNN